MTVNTVLIGLLLTMALAVGVVLVVALPKLRGGAVVLTPEGEQKIRRLQAQLGDVGDQLTQRRTPTTGAAGSPLEVAWRWLATRPRGGASARTGAQSSSSTAPRGLPVVRPPAAPGAVLDSSVDLSDYVELPTAPIDLRDLPDLPELARSRMGEDGPAADRP